MYTQNMRDCHSGYEEIEHTADWALHVWAPTLPELYLLAVEGMYDLSGTNFSANPNADSREFVIFGIDPESLLVNLLSEVLYVGEDEGLGVTNIQINFQDEGMRISFQTTPIQAQEKEIKAVTYHGLEIIEGVHGFDVTIIFDV